MWRNVFDIVVNTIYTTSCHSVNDTALHDNAPVDARPSMIVCSGNNFYAIQHQIYRTAKQPDNSPTKHRLHDITPQAQLLSTHRDADETYEHYYLLDISVKVDANTPRTDLQHEIVCPVCFFILYPFKRKDA